MKYYKLVIIAFLIVAIASVVVTVIFTLAKKNQEQLIFKVAVNLTDEQISKIKDNINKLQALIDEHKITDDRSDFMPEYLSLGINYAILGEYGLAREWYLRASTERPQASVPYSNLGTLYVMMGGIKLATQAFQQAIKLEPDYILNWQKWIEFNRYQLKIDNEALKAIYVEALKATNNNRGIVGSYAAFLEDIKDINAAISIWDGILRVDPYDKSAVQEATRLRNKYLK
jgi:tetratricopeptide (TPR) repeat protein